MRSDTAPPMPRSSVALTAVVPASPSTGTTQPPQAKVSDSVNTPAASFRIIPADTANLRRLSLQGNHGFRSPAPPPVLQRFFAAAPQ